MSEVLVLDKDVYRMLGVQYERKNYHFFMDMIEGNTKKYSYGEVLDALEYTEEVLETLVGADNPDVKDFKSNTVTDRETLEEHPEAAEINQAYIENYQPNFSGEAVLAQDVARDFPALVKAHAEGKTMYLEEIIPGDEERSRFAGFFNNIEELAHYTAKKIGIKTNEKTPAAENC